MKIDAIIFFNSWLKSKGNLNLKNENINIYINFWHLYLWYDRFKNLHFLAPYLLISLGARLLFQENMADDDSRFA